jgi:isocitrate/isopropylmalate dehydrogenase
MKRIRIAVVPGDGIGPEISKVTLDVLTEAASSFRDQLQLDYVERNIGYDVWQETGVYVEENGVKHGGVSEDILKCYGSADAMLYVATSGGSLPEGFLSPFPVVRRRFGIFANVRPARTLPKVFSIKPDIDLVLVREQTEGLWMGKETGMDNEVIHAQVTISHKATEKLAVFAFELARSRNRLKKVVCAHKSNVLPKAFGLFLNVFKEVSRRYVDCSLVDMHTDVLPYELIVAPEKLDVIATTNMYGDAISGEVAGICGGLGIAPSGEYGADYAIFRPVHGSAPDLKGKNVANPIATILSAAMMMDWLGNKHHSSEACCVASRIRRAVESVLKEGKIVTPDLGGTASTVAVAQAIMGAICT